MLQEKACHLPPPSLTISGCAIEFVEGLEHAKIQKRSRQP
jgi:hypothetical protein